MGGLAGVLSPIVVGFLPRAGDFRLPPTFIAVIEPLGVCSCILSLTDWNVFPNSGAPSNLHIADTGFRMARMAASATVLAV